MPPARSPARQSTGGGRRDSFPPDSTPTTYSTRLHPKHLFRKQHPWQEASELPEMTSHVHPAEQSRSPPGTTATKVLLSRFIAQISSLHCIRSDPERGAKPIPAHPHRLSNTGNEIWALEESRLQLSQSKSCKLCAGFKEQVSKPKEVGQGRQSSLLGVPPALRHPLPRSERVPLIMAR